MDDFTIIDLINLLANTYSNSNINLILVSNNIESISVRWLSVDFDSDIFFNPLKILYT